MSIIQKMMKLPNYIKAVAAVIGFSLSLVGAVVAMEDRYVSDKEAASSLQMLNQKLEYDIKDLRDTITRKELSYIQDQYYKLKGLLVKHPDDLELKIEFEEIKNKKLQLEKELN